MILFVDFDGTAASEIASQKLLERFALGNWREVDERLDRGEISFYECVRVQYNMIKGHRYELSQFAREQIELRSGFQDLIKHCDARGYHVHIVAEALDFMIRPVLEREGLGHLDLICDRGVFEDEHLIEIEFPNKRHECTCGLGNCKGGHVNDHAHHDLRIFIGDGSNDYCAAKRCDLIFARRKLAQLCERDRVEFTLFETFYDVLHHMQKLKL